MIEAICHYFKPPVPTALEAAKAELRENEVGLLKEETQREYHAMMSAYHRNNIMRLEAYIAQKTPKD